MAGSSLGEHAEIVMGQSPPGLTCNSLGHGLPLLNGPTEFGPHNPTPVQFTTSNRKRARRGDILFCVRGSTTGRMNWSDREYAIGRGVAAIRHKKTPQLQPFVRAVIEYSLQSLLAQATGSTFPNVSSSQLANLWWPPLDEAEQRAIAHILGTLDDKIELNRRMNETLEAMARAIFKSWFVDFDPVRAKAEGRQPYGMDAETAALFPDFFQDSPIGKIPTGWKLAPLPEAVHINPPRSLAKGRETTYLDMQNMPTRGHRPAGWIQRPFLSGSRFANGDTLIARITPCLENGKTAYVDFLKDGEVGWGSTEFIVLRPKDPLPPEYGYCLARDDEFRAHAIQNMTGSSGRQRVPTDCFSQYFVSVPPEPVARRFGQAVRPLFAKVKGNSEEAATLVAIRDALLPKLISGEVRVPLSHRPAEVTAL